MSEVQSGVSRTIVGAGDGDADGVLSRGVGVDCATVVDPGDTAGENVLKARVGPRGRRVSGLLFRNDANGDFGDGVFESREGNLGKKGLPATGGIEADGRIDEIVVNFTVDGGVVVEKFAN